MVAKQYVFSFVSILILILLGLLLISFGTGLTTVAALGVAIFLVFILVAIMVLASGGINAGAAVLGSIGIYIFRLTLSHIYRPTVGETPSYMYKIISSDLIYLACVALLLFSSVWLVSCILFSQSTTEVRLSVGETTDDKNADADADTDDNNNNININNISE